MPVYPEQMPPIGLCGICSIFTDEQSLYKDSDQLLFAFSKTSVIQDLLMS